jgi:nitrate reductase beta subunit
MEYPYEAPRPRRQFTMIMDTNKCIACQSCTIACKSTWTWGKGQEFMLWNNIETKPYGFYPTGWDVNILELLGEQAWDGDVYAGQTVFEAAPPGERVLGWAPGEEDWSYPNIGEDEPTGSAEETTYMPDPPHSMMWMYYLQRICNHCTYPACVAACPRDAIYKRPEDGVVLVDQARCRGYQECLTACPYKKTTFNLETRVSEKCIACYPRVEGKDPEHPGVPLETRCMAACIGQIRLQGLVKMNPDGTWAEDRQHPLYYLVHVAKVALPLYPQFGTEPNGYYIPPRWVPRPYLRQMFGPGVDQAIARYENPDRELTAVLQLFRRSNRMIFGYKVVEGPKVYEGTLRDRTVTVYDDTVIAYGKDGQELFRTTVEEPVHVRPARHANSI